MGCYAALSWLSLGCTCSKVVSDLAQGAQGSQMLGTDCRGAG